MLISQAPPPQYDHPTVWHSQGGGCRVSGLCGELLVLPQLSPALAGGPCPVLLVLVAPITLPSACSPPFPLPSAGGQAVAGRIGMCKVRAWACCSLYPLAELVGAKFPLSKHFPSKQQQKALFCLRADSVTLCLRSEAI